MTLEQENEKLKTDVAMLRDALKFYADGKNYYEELECFGGQCVVKEFGHKAQEVISATSSSDAWLKEQKAKVLEEAACAFESNGADAMFAVDELRRMTAELRSAPAEATCKSCDGNDGDKPCAYPSEGKHGCLRDARMRTPESDDDQSIRIR